MTPATSLSSQIRENPTWPSLTESATTMVRLACCHHHPVDRGLGLVVGGHAGGRIHARGPQEAQVGSQPARASRVAMGPTSS